MRTYSVVVLSPAFGECFGFYERIEDFSVEQFISEFAIERFDVAVAQRLPSSIKSVLSWSRLSQVLTAVEQDSGPLSDLICPGGPC